MKPKLLPIHTTVKNLTSSAFLFLTLFFVNFTAYSQTDKKVEIKKQLEALRFSDSNSVTRKQYIDLLEEFAFNLRYTQPDTLLYLARELCELSQPIAYTEGMIASELTYANHFMFAGKADIAQIHIDRAVKLGFENNFYEKISKAYNLQGTTAFMATNYPKAYLSFQESIKYALEAKSQIATTSAYMNLATMFSLLNNYGEALELYRKALRANLGAEKNSIHFQILSNIAFLETNMGQCESALKNIEMSIQAFEKSSNYAWLAFCYNTKGNLYLKLKNYNEALKSFDRGREIHENLKDTKGKADIMLGLANANYGLLRTELAENYGNKSLSLYTQMNIKTGLEKVYRTLSQVKEAQFNPNDALQYLKKANVYADSISKSDKSANIDLLHTIQQYEQEQDKIVTTNKTRIEQQKRVLLIISIALLGTLIILYFIYEANQESKRTNEKLAVNSFKLEANQKSLQELNIMKDKIFSVIGHDFREPISNLKQLLHMISNEYLKPNDQKEILSKLTYQTESIHFMLDNLLFWGKMQMKGFKVVGEQLDLSEIIAQNVGFFKEQLSEKNIEAKVYIEENTVVWADKNYVALILRNLISNAIKFSFEDQEISIRARIKQDHVITQIEDKGIGFEKNRLERVMEDNQYHSTFGTSNEKGTGLGLLFCKEAVQLNMGELWIESLNQKTIVYFSLPLTNESVPLLNV